MTTNDEMRAILALDPEAKLLFSDCTGQWYVSGRFEISDGAFITAPTEHRATPEQAISAMFERLFKLKPLERLVVNGHRLGDR